MLNYILPPIIIIISVSILIMFLFRKAAQIPAGDFIIEEQKRESEKNSVKILSAVGQIGLKFLERLMHHAKLLSLKFHNVSNVWFQTIREKRQRSAQLQKELQEQKMAKFSASTSEVDNLIVERQIVRPMVRENVTMPQQQAKPKEKNKLEDALIRRIAINPKDIEAYERLGDYYMESENFQDSLECFKEVLRLSPTHQKAKLRIKRLERIR